MPTSFCNLSKIIHLKLTYRLRTLLAWSLLAALIFIPLGAAAASPLHAWREPVYIIASFAGCVALALLLAQPLMAGSYMPSLTDQRSKRLHRLIGGCLVLAVVIHVGGLWITSPPDVIDALTFTSPTWFSIWGVIAMWGVFATAALFTRRKALRPRQWRLAHTAFAIIIVAATVGHAMLIDGTMELVTKTALCVAVVVATVKLIGDRGIWRTALRRHR